MDSDKIVSILETALNFFGDKMQSVYELLIIDPTTYMDGSIWDMAMKIYMGLVGVGFSIISICAYIGIIAGMETMYQAKRPSVIFTIFLNVVICGGVMAAAPDLLLIVVKFCQGIIRKACGDDFISSYVFSVPGAVYNNINGLSTIVAVLLWLVCLIGAVVIVASAFTILMLAYGRIFKLYLYIALSPIGLASCASKQTMRIGINYIKTFIVTGIEGLVIVAAFAIFTAFNDGYSMDINSESAIIYEEQKEALIDAGYTEENAVSLLEDAWSENIMVREATRKTIEDVTGKSWNYDVEDDAFKIVFSYILQQSFLFLLLASLIKSADSEVRKIMG